MNTTSNAPDGLWRVKIDYLSITSGEFHVYDLATGEAPIDPTAYAAQACRTAHLVGLRGENAHMWTPQSGRSGYSQSASLPIGTRLFWGHATGKPLLELGGAACDALHAEGALLALVERNTEGVTRIDLAADLTCELSPAQFLAYGRSSRHASSGRASSATGETEYIGSPTSDRRCRVYRYAPPHPRSDALRVEVVLRRELAKSAALDLLTKPLDHVFSAAAAPFEFRCPQWSLPATSKEPRRTIANEPTAASRLRWLEKQIRPAVLEAHRGGLIDLREWLDSLDA